MALTRRDQRLARLFYRWATMHLLLVALAGALGGLGVVRAALAASWRDAPPGLTAYQRDPGADVGRDLSDLERRIAREHLDIERRMTRLETLAETNRQLNLYITLAVVAIAIDTLLAWVMRRKIQKEAS